MMIQMRKSEANIFPEKPTNPKSFPHFKAENADTDKPNFEDGHRANMKVGEKLSFDLLEALPKSETIQLIVVLSNVSETV